MVPPIYNVVLVKQILVLVEIRCARCGRHRVLPRDSHLERVSCKRCGHTIHLRRQAVR